MSPPSRRPVNVLYIHTAGRIGGGNKVLLHLQSQLDRSVFGLYSVIPERGPVEAELRRQHVPYIVSDLRPDKLDVGTRVSALVRASAFCLRRRIGILHANDPLTYRAASAATAFPWVKRVCTVHHPGLTREAVRWAFRRMPHVIIVPSGFMRTQVLDLLDVTPRHGVEVVWNEIDTEWFSPVRDRATPRAALQIDPGAFHVSILGTLAPHKGHQCFLRAARRVLAEIPNTFFHIVGGDRPDQAHYPAELRALAEELGISARVRFWGFTDDNQARQVLQASDLFMLPTHEEGFGLSVAEAQACEVPVLTSRIQPLDEVVDEGRSGFLLPPDDDAAFAASAIELLRAPARRTEMGRHARQWTVQRFGQGSYARRVTSLYGLL